MRAPGRAMRCSSSKTRIGSRDVLDHVLKQDLIEAVVLDRVGEGVEVVHDVRVRIR